MDKSTISITLRGNALKKGKWIEWYEYICSIIHELGYNRTHLAIESETYTTKKIVTISRKEKQILQLLDNGLQPTSFSIYSLPKDYKIASFDYNVLVVREKNYISFIVNRYDFEKLDVDGFVSQMKRYIEFDNGEIYQMDRCEVPLIYAAQANSLDTYTTLEVLKQL